MCRRLKNLDLEQQQQSPLKLNSNENRLWTGVNSKLVHLMVMKMMMKQGEKSGAK